MCLIIDLVHVDSLTAMQGTNRVVVPTEICLMTLVTLNADLNESDMGLQVRQFLNYVINQACNLIEERHIPYTPGHEILLKFSSTPPSAPLSKSKSETANPPRTADIELSHETNVNEDIDDILEITVEFLLNIA